MDKKVGVATRIKGIAFKLIVITLLLWVAISVIFAFKLRNSDTSQDFSSKELVVRSTDSEVIKGYSSKETIGDLTVFKFKSEEEAKK